MPTSDIKKGPLYVDSTNNRIGVGTSSPKTELNIAANNSGQGAKLTIENTDTAITTNDIIGQIDFYANDASTNGTGAKVNIKAVAESSAGTLTGLTFGTSDSASSTAVERMRIDSSGNVLVGTTDKSTITQGVKIRADGDAIAAVADGGVSGYFGRLNSDGEIVRFRKDSGSVGSIGTGSTANFQIYNAQTSHVGLEFGSPNIMPTNNSGSLTYGGAALGSSSYPFSDLWLSGGVYLGGTGSANLLDDYETGTFVPTFDGSTGGSVTLLSSRNVLSYTKIGRSVHISGRVDVSGTPSATGNLRLTNLPFTPVNLDDSAGNAVQFMYITIGATQTDNPCVIEITENSTAPNIRTLGWSGAAAVLKDTSRIQFGITYFSA